MPLASAESTLCICQCLLMVNLGVLKRESSRVGKMEMCDMQHCVRVLGL